MSESDNPSGIIPDTHGAFIEDLKALDLEIRSDAEIRDLIRRTRNENLSDEDRQKARNEVIEANLRAIPFVIKNLPKAGIQPEALVGEGFEVLNSCINNFDTDYVSPKTENEVKFSSYLITSLTKKLNSPTQVERIGDSVNLPIGVESYISVMKKVREGFLQEHHREPTAEEWYKSTVDFIGENRSFKMLKNFTPEAFEGVKSHRIQKRYIPIGSRVGSGRVNNETLSPNLGNIEETIADPSADTEEEVLRELLKDEVGQVLNFLPPRQRFIIEWRYGIGFDEKGKPKEPLTYEQIGDMLGLTRERVRQIGDKALRVLRHLRISSKVKSYVEDEDFGERKQNPFEEEADRYEKIEEYNKKIKKIAESSVGYHTPKEFMDNFSRLIFMANGNLEKTKKIYYGIGASDLRDIYTLTSHLGKTPFELVQDIAGFIDEVKKERIKENKSINQWGEIVDFRYTDEDYKKWVEQTNLKMLKS